MISLLTLGYSQPGRECTWPAFESFIRHYKAIRKPTCLLCCPILTCYPFADPDLSYYFDCRNTTRSSHWWSPSISSQYVCYHLPLLPSELILFVSVCCFQETPIAHFLVSCHAWATGPAGCLHVETGTDRFCNYRSDFRNFCRRVSIWGLSLTYGFIKLKCFRTTSFSVLSAQILVTFSFLNLWTPLNPLIATLRLFWRSERFDRSSNVVHWPSGCYYHRPTFRQSIHIPTGKGM